MTIEELKQTIEQRTGVPASLLTGETAEENIAQAKAMLAYKREHKPQRPETIAEQFGKWLDYQFEEKDRQAASALGLHYEGQAKDPALAALADIEEAARVEAGGYPMIMDGGEVARLSDSRPAREQFSEWLGQKAAFDPTEGAGGWKML